MERNTLYVIAGPNGIGKTTSTYDLVPKSIPVINSDEIAKQIRLTGIAANINTQEYSNREATLLIQENLDKQISFGIETNLCDVETWKFLIGVQKLGYLIHLIYLSTNDLELLDQRIEERTKRGEHFVMPAVVRERYINSLKLLDHYFQIPDKITLIDNSRMSVLVLEKAGGLVEIANHLPAWVTTNLARHFTPKENEEVNAKDLSSKEAVKELYQKSLRKK